MNDVKESLIGNKFGYAEMYEWYSVPDADICPFGRLVQFNSELPFTIEFATNYKKIIGVSTINSVEKSDEPKYWPYRYLFNEYGDIYLEKKIIASASKEYDELEEISYIKTSKEEVLTPIVNKNYDPDKKYIVRSHRNEWCQVTLLGKAIIEDNGECKAGEYCTLYSGNDREKIGTVVPAKEDDEFKLYVMNRVSNKTILVFFK